MTALFENIIITYSEKGQRVCTLYVYIYCIKLWFGWTREKNKTDKELSKLTSVFHECGKGSVQLMAKHHKCKHNDKHKRW